MPEGNIALIDMDGTVADYEGQLRHDLNLLRHPDEPLDIWSDEPHVEQRRRLVKALPGWWRKLQPITNGLLVVQLMRSHGFQLQILTKGPKHVPMAWAEKVEWCQEHIPDAYPTICQGVPEKGGGKDTVYGKVLFDDYPNFMIPWLEHRPRGLGIMLANDQNKHFCHRNVVKFDGNNLDEVNRALSLAATRKSGEPLILEK